MSGMSENYLIGTDYLFLQILTMTSQEIRVLLTPPDIGVSNKKALSFLNEKFNLFEDLDDIETTVQQCSKDAEDLNSQVRFHNAEISGFKDSLEKS